MATNLRRAIAETYLRSPMAEGTGDGDISMRQQLRLSELELEKYAFVLLSQVDTAVSAPGGLAQGGAMWAPALKCALLVSTSKHHVSKSATSRTSNNSFQIGLRYPSRSC
eukprot:187186-Prorocentrum_minimum.AAC.1